VLSVTHDVGEAFLLEAEVVRIAQGRVAAQGAVEEVLAAERTSLLGVLR
jgi:molybdate transport system ATP-binding protein